MAVDDLKDWPLLSQRGGFSFTAPVGGSPLAPSTSTRNLLPRAVAEAALGPWVMERTRTPGKARGSGSKDRQHTARPITDSLKDMAANKTYAALRARLTF
jgi:hypothetical protein